MFLSHKAQAQPCSSSLVAVLYVLRAVSVVCFIASAWTLSHPSPQPSTTRKSISIKCIQQYPSSYYQHRTIERPFSPTRKFIKQRQQGCCKRKCAGPLTTFSKIHLQQLYYPLSHHSSRCQQSQSSV